MKGQLDKLKAEYLTPPTSETVLGLPQPEPHMCRDIDEIIYHANRIDVYADDIGSLEKDAIIERVDWIQSRVIDLKNDAENVRSQVERLREWGQAWKELAKQLLENEKIDLEEVINDN